MITLLRRRKGTDTWKSTATGNAEFITETLRLHLTTPELSDYEWKVTPIDEN